MPMGGQAFLRPGRGRVCAQMLCVHQEHAGQERGDAEDAMGLELSCSSFTPIGPSLSHCSLFTVHFHSALFTVLCLSLVHDMCIFLY